MNKKVTIIVIFSIIVVILAGLTIRRFIETGDAAPLPTVTATIGGQQFDLEVATTVVEQERGLSGRDSLGENSGMLFLFNAPSVQSFWMIDMEFPLDMIWIDGDKIVGFEQNAPTPEDLDVTDTADLPVYVSPSLVNKVIEVNAGEVAHLGLKVGDTVQINLGSS